MRTRVRWALPLLVGLLLLFITPASAGRIKDLYVSPDGTDSGRAVHWTASSGKHYLMLPAGCDLSSWKIGFEGDAFTVDGQTVASGDAASFLVPGETMDLVSGKTTYKLVVMQSTPSTPSIWLQTSIENYYTISKTRTATADMIVMSGTGETVYTGKVARVRVHGNSSHYFNKKSYDLKLEEKADLLGLGKNRDFVLLSLYRDSSHLRTSIVYDLARYAGLPTAMGWQLAQVYFNGEYYGIFLVTGKV